MGDYFILECLDPPEGFLAQIEYRDGRNWNAGRRFADPPSSPIEAKVQLRKGSVLREFADVPLPIMTKRLHQAMLDGGVSNLDVYPMRLVDKKTGVDHGDQYLAFNIVGVIAAADLEKTSFADSGSPRRIASNINSLAIDEAKARGARLFRLAEAVNGIVIHRSVMEAIERAGIDTLSFIDPADWAG